MDERRSSIFVIAATKITYRSLAGHYSYDGQQACGSRRPAGKNGGSRWGRHWDRRRIAPPRTHLL